MTNHSFTFHVASEGDTDDILNVETRAFGYSKEARLVASLLHALIYLTPAFVPERRGLSVV